MQSVPLETRSRIRQLIGVLLRKKPGSEKTETPDVLADLEDLILKHGVRNDDLVLLLDLVLSSGSCLTRVQRRYVVTQLLVPDQSEPLPIEIIYRILGLVGSLEQQSKGSNSPAPKSLQLHLLEWLLCSIHLFGSEVYLKLHHMSPILFNYLSYEYPRPYISHLIFLALTTNIEQTSLVYNTVKQPVKSVKLWQVQKVVDLYAKFPGDEYLKALLVVFRTLDPNLNLDHYARGTLGITSALNLNPAIFKYGKDDYMERLRTVSANNDIIKENEKAREKAVTKLESISYISGRYKRRKQSNDNGTLAGNTYYLFNPLKTSIVEIQSIKDMVTNFERISCVSSDALLKKPVLTLQKRLERLYVNLNSVGATDPFLESILSSTKFAFEDPGLSYSELVSIVDNLIVGLRALIANNVHLFVKDFVLGYVSPKLSLESDTEYKVFLQRLRLVRYLSPKYCDKVNDKLLSSVLAALSQSTSRLWEDVLCSMFLNMKDWYLQLYLLARKAGTTSVKGARYMGSINRGLHEIASFINAYVLCDTSLKADVHILQFLQIFNIFDAADFNSLLVSTVVLHSSTVYHFLLSTNAYVVSEICGYIARSKAYDISDQNQQPYKMLRNAYVTDAVNFLWRNQSFRYQKDTPNKAMLLLPQFLDLAAGKLLINDSGIVTFEELGNLFHNPGFAFLSAQLMWKLEDSDTLITVRHLGPVSPSSILKLRNDANEKWLDMTYTQLLVHILNELEKMGFDGLSEFIFTSVAGIQSYRTSGVEV